MGQVFGGTLMQAEVDYLIDEEWACTAEDILTRRSKLTLYLSEEQVAQLESYIANRKQSTLSSVQVA